MTNEYQPPRTSRNGRIVEIDGGKASEMAALGHKHSQPSKGQRPAGGASGCRVPKTPAVGAEVSRVAGVDLPLGEPTVTPRATAGDAGSGNHS